MKTVHYVSSLMTSLFPNPISMNSSLQSYCCVDKKGILSWPNPTAEKVFFLRGRGQDDSFMTSSTAPTESEEGRESADSGTEEPPGDGKKRGKGMYHD